MEPFSEAELWGPTTTSSASSSRSVSSSRTPSPDLGEEGFEYFLLHQREKELPPVIGPASSSSTHPPETLASRLKKLHNKTISKETSVVFIGNPGVGKSTLLNCLGGEFPSGFSLMDGLTKVVTSKTVKLKGRKLRLVDMPGIYESDKGIIERNLKALQEQLNDGTPYVIFFVLSPRNGRIDPNDMALMSLVLGGLQEGPLVGIVWTQVPEGQEKQVQNPEYLQQVIQRLKRGKANTKFLKQNNALVLLRHEMNFSDEDKNKIHEYVLAFKPRQVRVRELVVSMFTRLREFFLQMKEALTGGSAAEAAVV